MFNLVPYTSRNNSLISVFDDLMNDSFFNMTIPSTFTRSVFTEDMVMKTDIKETETELIFETELPGIKKEEISVKLENKILTISVNRNEDLNEEQDGYIRKERRTGSHSRSFRVVGVKEEGVRAKYEEGMLKVVLQKNEKQLEPQDNKIVIE